MPLIQVPVGVTPCQVDDFPAEVVEGDGKKRPFERSCKGALHLRPATTRRVTADELGHLRKAKLHKDLGRRLLEVQVKTKEAKKAPEKPHVPKDETPAPPVVKPKKKMSDYKG